MLQQRPLFVSFVDLQKAYDTVQHGLLWARLEGIGVGPRMLAAFKSMYASGTLSWPVPRCCGVHAYVHVAQGPEVCLPLSHCLTAEGSNMNTIPSS